MPSASTDARAALATEPRLFGPTRPPLAREAGGDHVKKVGKLLLCRPSEMNLTFRPAQCQVLLALRRDLQPRVGNRVMASRATGRTRRNHDESLIGSSEDHICGLRQLKEATGECDDLRRPGGGGHPR